MRIVFVLAFVAVIGCSQDAHVFVPNDASRRYCEARGGKIIYTRDEDVCIRSAAVISLDSVGLR